MQLARWLVPALIVCSASAARADGNVRVRGAYYKERATRVEQPMVDALFDVGDDGSQLQMHTLVDSITSASAAAGSAGQPFTETRYELGAGYMHNLGRFGLGGALRFSTEPDYQSVFFTLRGHAELAQRNTIFDVAMSRGHDTVSNESAQTGGLMEPITGTLNTTMSSISVTQVLTPLLVAGLTYDLTYLNGFQENPYRTVSAGGVGVRERVPDVRWRNAVFGSVRGFVPPTQTVVFGGYRFYADSWGIHGHTPEVRVIQQITPGLFVHLRYRYYRQSTGADFYRDVYDTADPNLQPYLTDDDKLGRMTSQTYSLKLELGLHLLGLRGRLGQVRAETLFEYITQTTHYGNAVVGEAALVVPFEY